MAVPPESPALPDGNWREGLRSLWHLSRHLTARADDNHAAPPRPPLLAGRFHAHPAGVRARVRFLAYHRIKPHVPPLVRAPVNSFEFHVRAPVNSFEFHRCRRTPQAGHLTLSLGLPRLTPRKAGVHRLPCGLPGYLILFDTRTFEHQRQKGAGRLPSRSEFFVISKHFTATPRIPPAPRPLKNGSFDRSSGVEPRHFTADLQSRLRSLQAQ